MFRKLVAIEPVSLVPSAEKALNNYAEEVVVHTDIPADDEEIIARIGDADAVLLSYTSQIDRYVLERCPNIRYIGMCCSLYSPESANVDIRFANDERGITVTGIRDYGDEGGDRVRGERAGALSAWFRAGALGADAPRDHRPQGRHRGAGEIGRHDCGCSQILRGRDSLFCLQRKPAAAEKGYRFMPLDELLSWSEAVFCCLNKNTVLLHEAEFEALGNRKILFNTGLSPAWDEAPFARWLEGTTSASAIHWGRWAMRNSLPIRTCAACRYPPAAPARRSTA